MKNPARLLTGAAMLLALAACQGPVAQVTSPTSSATPGEVNFTTNAYQIIQFDREESKLAETQAKDPRVKALAAQFGQQANDFAAKLDPIAAQSGIKPPTELRNDLRVRLGQMRIQQGRDFDRMWVSDQIASHEEEVMMQDQMSGASVSPQYAALIKQGQALVKQNLETLRGLQRQVGTPR